MNAAPLVALVGFATVVAVCVVTSSLNLVSQNPGEAISHLDQYSLLNQSYLILVIPAKLPLKKLLTQQPPKLAKS